MALKVSSGEKPTYCSPSITRVLILTITIVVLVSSLRGSQAITTGEPETGLSIKSAECYKFGSGTLVTVEVVNTGHNTLEKGTKVFLTIKRGIDVGARGRTSLRRDMLVHGFPESFGLYMNSLKEYNKLYSLKVKIGSASGYEVVNCSEKSNAPITKSVYVALSTLFDRFVSGLISNPVLITLFVIGIGISLLSYLKREKIKNLFKRTGVSDTEKIAKSFVEDKTGAKNVRISSYERFKGTYRYLLKTRSGFFAIAVDSNGEVIKYKPVQSKEYGKRILESEYKLEDW